MRQDLAAGRSELALVSAGRGLTERLLFAGSGRFGSPSWSPGGTGLLLPWPDADQWLFLPAVGRGRTTAVAHIAGQFSPGGTRPAFPRSATWCCTPG